MLYVASFCSCLKQTDEVYVEWLTELLRHVGKVWSKHAVEYSAAHMPVSKSLLTTAAARGRVRHCSALDTAGSGAHLSFARQYTGQRLTQSGLFVCGRSCTRQAKRCFPLIASRSSGCSQPSALTELTDSMETVMMAGCATRTKRHMLRATLSTQQLPASRAERIR